VFLHHNRHRERDHSHLGDERAMSIALENLYNRSNHAFGIESEGFSAGMFCVTPEPVETLAAADGAR
jgi:hypothetical protein